MRNNGAVIKAAMVMKKETVPSLSEKSGVSESHLYNVRAGYEPSLTVKMKIAQALNMSVGYLFPLKPEELEVIYSKDHEPARVNEG
jgi:transcriptional regulator with XRE-family HTH domain